MKRLFSLVAAGTILLATTSARAAEAPRTLPIWPGTAPGEKGDVGPEKTDVPKPDDKHPVTRVTNVTQPTIAIYRPPTDRDTGAAVVICPGGGYNILAIDLEGQEVATWLNSIGVTGIVLKYRVPRRPSDPKDKPPACALQDAQRALSLVRSKAGELGIDPKRIGILGFSAGGHLSASAATNFDKRAYEAIDEVDRVSCRPDFAVLVYPAYLVGKDKTQMNPEIRVSSQTPPTFLAHAGNDGVGAENSIAFYLACKHAKVPAELHVYTTGGHGFGLRPTDEPCSTWPQRCGEWLKKQGFLKGEKAK